MKDFFYFFYVPTAFIGGAIFGSNIACAGGGKLLETAGVTQVEGSGGGGLVPWAVLSGYDTREEWSVQTYITKLSLEDFRLQSYGASIGLFNRFELSASEQLLDLRTITAGEREIRQHTFGAKVRLWGDFVYGEWPQISVGIQHKRLSNGLIAKAVGARDGDQGTDFYLVASKAHLGAAYGYNAFWNLALRGTRANQFGLLGFGGDKDNSYQLMAEASVGFLFGRHLAAGVEYRQKPDNLSSVREEDAWDIFVVYLPNKHLNLTVAWAQLGDVAGQDDQEGLYISLTGYLW